MTWTLSPRPPSKATEPAAKPSAPATKPPSPPKPDAPDKGDKPHGDHPYPAPPGQYWRWSNLRQAGLIDEQDADELVRYVLDFLRNHQGVADPIAYIADVDREDRQLEVRARRARRLAAFRA